jgi:Methyltransferase domain
MLRKAHDVSRQDAVVLSRGGRRRLRLGLPTVLGFAKRGFFIPCRYATLADEAAPGYPALEPIFRAAEPSFQGVIERIEGYGEALTAIGAEPPPQPRWRQSWFPRLDAAAAYALVRSRAPQRIVEVGCGHSTRFLARAIADGGLGTWLTAIDPAPRATIESLPVRLIREPVQRADPGIFAALGPGDVLAIDSSHVLMPGTDVDVLLNRVLPALPAGVLVHVHDVFLPDGYPPAWAWRGYNEQLAIGALIQGGGWRLIWSSRYVTARMAERLQGRVAGGRDRPDGAFESSLWLEKTG